MENPTATVSGTLLINHLCAHVLFNSGATHSFVNPSFAKKLASKHSEMDVKLYVTTPLGSTYYTDLVFKNCAIQLEGSPPCRPSTARYTRLGRYSRDGLVN